MSDYLLPVLVSSIATAVYFTVQKLTLKSAYVFMGVVFFAVVLSILSIVYMKENYDGSAWGTNLGWPLPICHGFIESKEFTHTYHVQTGINNPFAPNARIHLRSCVVSRYRLSEDITILMVFGLALTITVSKMTASEEFVSDYDDTSRLTIACAIFEVITE